MTRWWWVRHGPTHQRAFTGWRDVPADLSDHAALSRLRAHVPGDALMISSDLLRASTTATAIQTDQTRLPHSAKLREIHFGDWDGLHFSEVAKRDPDLSRRYWEEPGDVAAPGGESWNMASERVSQLVDTFNAEGHADIIAVCHFGVILTQLQRATGRSAYQTLAQEIDPLSVTELSYHEGVWSVGAVNYKLMGPVTNHHYPAGRVPGKLPA